MSRFEMFQLAALVFLCITATIRTTASLIVIRQWRKEAKGEMEVPIRKVVVISKKKAKEMGLHI